MSKLPGIYNANVLRYLVLQTSMHLTVLDHRQQPSLNKTKKQPNNQLLTLATLLLNDIYYPVIDTALSELDRRFGGANSNIICGIGALIPGSDQFLEYSSLITKFAEQCKSNVGDSALELKQMKRMIERKRADNTMPVFGENTSTLLDFCILFLNTTMPSTS